MHISRFRRSTRFREGRAVAAAALLSLALALACAGAAGAAPGVPAAGEALPGGESLLRFHVVAHSDAPGDQEAKLKVRDALLSEMTGRGTFAAGAEAEAWVKANEKRLVEAARKALLDEGLDYPVRIESGRFYFPEKQAGGLTLPAGEYRAVQVIIGDGAGQNWWCVLFPPLCFVEEEVPAPAEAAPGGLPPQLLAAGVPGSEPPVADAGAPADAPRDAPERGAGEDGAPGEAPGVKWKLRLWERLSQTAYAARLREMMELAWRSLRDEAM